MRPNLKERSPKYLRICTPFLSCIIVGKIKTKRCFHGIPLTAHDSLLTFAYPEQGTEKLAYWVSNQDSSGCVITIKPKEVLKPRSDTQIPLFTKPWLHPKWYWWSPKLSCFCSELRPVESVMSSPSSSPLTIFHFNDVYNVEPGTIEPLGGAARLVTAVKGARSSNPMVLFSGDCLNPSLSEYSRLH